MTRDARITCAVCAWRGDCRKKFSMTNAAHCPDFTRDISIKEPPPEPEEPAEPADPKQEEPSS